MVEKAATATRELEATAGPEVSCRNAGRADLDAKAMVMDPSRCERGDGGVNGQRSGGAARATLEE